jgi:arylsulfatase A-like enzyme
VANAALICVVAGVSAILSARHLAIPSLMEPSAPDPHRPPVVLISLDTTGTDHLSAYGYSRNTTPFLIDFARGATLFRNATAASDMTLSSHASMFTGVYPSWHGAHAYSNAPGAYAPLDEKLPTLAGILSGSGYTTAGAAANYFVSRRWGLTRGFQFFSSPEPILLHRTDRLFPLRSWIGRLLGLFPEFESTYRTSPEINQDAFNVLAQRAFSSRSFFLFVNYMDAHVPRMPPASYRDRFPHAGKSRDMEWYRKTMAEFSAGKRRLSESEYLDLVAAYDAGIAYQDAEFHDLIERLKAQNLYDRSLIIVTADHGEAFGEHRLFAHGTGVYGVETHVPLVVKFPNQKSGNMVDTAVSGVDLMPTILEVAGCELPPASQGVSLAHTVTYREVLSESFPTPELGSSLDRVERSIQSGGAKLIVNSKGKHELYDLDRDPQELAPLGAASPLNERLRAWIRTMPAMSQKPTPQDAQAMRRLKTLGYVQ